MNKDLEELKHKIMWQQFYEKYIMSEDEKMMAIIHENARKHKNDKLIEKYQNKRKKAVYGVLAILLVIIVIVIGALWIK